MRQKGARIRSKGRVKSQRQQLYHILKSDAQIGCSSKDVENSYNYYGNAVGGNTHKHWNVQFGLLPHDENILKSRTRTKLTVVLPGEERKESSNLPPPKFLWHSSGIL